MVYILLSNNIVTGYKYINLFLFIYLCVILHGNDSMRMLKHHVVDLTVIGNSRHQHSSKVKSTESWQCSVVAHDKLKGLSRIQICVVKRVFG